MCGFVAIVEQGAGAVRPTLLQAMADTLTHRGPDGEGRHVDGKVGLAHKRLSIIDVDHGQQPMHDPQDDLWVVFNGEIYNFVELQQEIRARGRTLQTRCDTEVLLHLYALEGEAFVERLNGMFAFFLYDRRRQRALVARDHFGIKPLYYHLSPERLIYASEIKAIVRHPAVQAAPDWARVHDYVTFQHGVDDGTMFRGVHKVLPGHLQRIDLASGNVTTRRFWEPTYTVDTSLSEADALEQLDALVQDAVRLQVRSDVPVGAHLSGGLDSSLVTTLAAPLCEAPFPAFHGCFDAGPQFDETNYAAAVAYNAGVELVKVPIDGSCFADTLPRLVWFMDEPVAGPGLYPQYEVSRVAAQRVKVALGGQGGDELFCGYTRYLVAYLEQALRGAIYQNNEEGEHIVSLTSILPNLPFLEQYVPMLRRFWSRGLFESPDRRYFSLLDRSDGQMDVFTGDFRAAHDTEAVFARFQAVFHHPQTKSYISKMRNFDRVASLPALLHVEDRVSMSVSLESRVPLLDHRIADLLDRLPPRVLFGGGHLKHLLRTVASSRLPASVAARKDKMGFPFPLDDWLRGQSNEFVHDVLLSKRCVERGLIDRAAVSRLLERRDPFSRKLWGLMNLELWFRTFIDDQPTETV